MQNDNKCLRSYKLSPVGRASNRAANLGNKNACGKRTPEQCATIRAGTIIAMTNPEVRKKIGIASQHMWEDPKMREKLTTAGRVWQRSIELRMKISASLTGLKRSTETCKKLHKALIRKWQDPEYREKQIRMIMEGLNQVPTEPEVLLWLLLDELYPDEFSYNGQMDAGINVGGRVPDFVHNNGRKLAILMHGDYWHEDEDVRKIQKHYANYGYKLLVIWEREINSNWDAVTQKIQAFMEC